MATFTTFGPYLDLIGSTAVQWKIISTASTGVVLENGLQQLVIQGNFAIGPSGDVSGTATAVNLLQTGYSGLPVFQATDLTIDGGKFLDTVLKATTDTQIYSALLAGSDTIVGSAGKDILQGFAGSDNIRAGGGNDRIGTDAGSDVIDGGAGFDTVLYKGAYADYRIERTGDAWTISDLKGTGGSDTLTGVERVYFDDKDVALISVDNTGGQLFRLYQAAFGRNPDEPGLDFWTQQIDGGGATLTGITGAFTASAEFQKLYGTGLSNRDLVVKYYEHILHRAPDQAGLDFWTDALDRKIATRGEVLAGFSESQESVDLSVQLIGNGLVFDAPIMTM
jgi:Ca2+-binding RTX toxin-like protein